MDILDSHEIRTSARGIYDIEMSLINEWTRLHVNVESYTVMIRNDLGIMRSLVLLRFDFA